MKPIFATVLQVTAYALLFFASVLSMLLPYRMELFFLLPLLAFAGILAHTAFWNSLLSRRGKIVTLSFAGVAALVSVLFLLTHAYFFYYAAVSINLLFLFFRSGATFLFSSKASRLSLRIAAGVL